MRRLFGITTGLLLALGLAVALAAQPSTTIHWVDASGFPTMRASLGVAGASGAPLRGLSQGAFSVVEDNRTVQATVSEQLDPLTPIAVVFAIDVSGSMGTNGGLDAVRAGLPAVLNSLSPSDMVVLVSFASSVTSNDWTADKSLVSGAAAALRAGGDTALFDAVVRSLRVAGAAPLANRAVVLLTDGRESGNMSAFTRDAALREATTAGVAVYALALGDEADTALLDQLAGLSGGQSARVASAAEIPTALRRVADELRRSYVVSWRSGLPADKDEHNLSIRVSVPGGGEVRAERKFRTQGVPPVPRVTALEGSTPRSVTSSLTIDTTIDAQSAIASVAYFLDGVPVYTTAASPYRYVLNTSTMPRGKHTIRVVATDVDRNVGERSYSFIVGGLGVNPAWLALTIGAAATLLVGFRASRNRRGR